MSDYGCCTLSVCYWADGAEGFGSCDDCPFYDKNYFRECEICQRDECEINKDMGRCTFEITGELVK